MNRWGCGTTPRQAVQLVLALVLWFGSLAQAVTIQFNSTGGTTATNGLHFYIEDTTKIQVRRLNNTGQVYAPGATPPSNSLDNGIFLRANGRVYGPSHTVTTFNPNGGMYNTYSITAATPANPTTAGVQQTATGSFGITSGPQVTVQWKYTTPLDFLTAEVTLVIPAAYAVSAANPVRYYHVFDTYLGGSDNGCGFTYVDATTGDRFVGTYQPTSGGCTTTTGIPAGINVVESFRERDGVPFTAYCASGWASFFVNGSTNCSVLQAANMSNALQATFADTGIGIQYSFTAPGTYTFSYDFVIGSPNVPPYDHLEIQHDGSGSLCPEAVTVLACTSSTVPCPALSVVNTGTLTGSVTTSPAAPAVTKTPATFTLGSSASTQAVSLQAAAGGTVTLGTSGLSTVPLNGTKCWNTATSAQSCSMAFAATPCISGYECLETGVAYNNLVTTPSARNPLYTKLSGTNFTFDVVALQSTGAIATSYTAAANVTVELFDDSTSPAPACSAYTSPVASQAITFAAANNGRKTLSTAINLPNAYSKLRCRVRDSNLSPTLYGCSSDTFAVRPLQFTVSSSNANADAAGTNTSATPTTKAGAAFNLTANTSTVGYNGTPSVNTANAAAHTGAIQTGTVVGTFGAASAATGNGAAGASFTYTEAGYFRFNANGVIDSTFTAVDSATADCVVGSSTNTAAGGKYGCNVGNAVSPYFGRFIPDHFDTVASAGCSAFTYSGQPFAVSVTAKNSAGATTQNYDGTSGSAFAKNTTLSPVTASGGSAIAPATGTLSSGTATAASFRRGTTGILGTVAVSNGSVTVTGTGTAFSTQLAPGGVICLNSVCYTIASVGSNTTLTLSTPYTGATASGLGMQPGQTFTFANRQTPPLGVFVRAIDSESVSSLRTPAGSSVEGGTTVRSGRVRLNNAYGSERLTTGLPIPVTIEYYDTATAAGWRTGTDTCTALAASQFAYTYSGTPFAACRTAGTLSGTNPNLTLTLAQPVGATPGWTDLVLNLGAVASGNTCTTANAETGFSGAATTANAPWLQHNWTGTVGNPAARATFGVFKSPLIYRRENY